jgi:peptidoglycan/LPS O-acetylase OafA/YrhL
MVARDFNMDVSRVAAIILVTGFHLWRFYGAPAAMVGGIDLYAPLASGFVGVDLFFVVSGYAMMLTWERQSGSIGTRVTSFALARILRIYPTYLIAICFWVLLVQQGIAVKPIGLADVVSHLIFAHTLQPETFFSISGVFWSLAVEAHFYLLFPFLAIASRRTRGLVVAAALFYTALVTWLLQGRTDGTAFVLKWNVVGFLPLFILGMELRSLPRLRNAKFLAAFSGIAAVALLLHPGLMFESLPYPAQAQLALLERLATGAGLGTALLVLTPRHVSSNIAVRGVTRVAVASYSIYLYNYIFLVTALPVIPGIFGALLYGIGVFAFGLGAWFAIERPAEIIRHRLLRSGVNLRRRPEEFVNLRR